MRRFAHKQVGQGIKCSVNAIFFTLFFLSTLFFLIFAPQDFLPALLSGGAKAGTLSLSLLATYCVWLGFFQVMEKSGLSKMLTRRALPLCKRLFRTNDEEAIFYAAGNLSANLLGLPGAPTPLGVKATERFYQQGNRYGGAMLFVLNATSLQLLPSTVLALRASFGSIAPADIILPTLITTAFSTLLGGVLVRLLVKR